MKRTIVAFALVALALGCGSREDSGATTPSESVPSAAAPAQVETTPAPVTESDVASCLQLAERKEWAAAVAPCTRAAKQRPDDLKIRHALQQAQAGAAEAFGS